MQRASVEVWFEFASTYSYLTVARAADACAQAGVDLVWRPFLLGPIFQARGMNTSPFVLDPLRGAYMWRDVARRAKRLGLPFERPPIFPMNGLRAARIMTAALDQPWCAAFAQAVFHAQFAQGRDISDEQTLSDALLRAGADSGAWLARANEQPVKEDLRARTALAESYGIFGAPSFRAGGELFWGDDRLEDALDWAKAHGSH